MFRIILQFLKQHLFLTKVLPKAHNELWTLTVKLYNYAGLIVSCMQLTITLTLYRVVLKDL